MSETVDIDALVRDIGETSNRMFQLGVEHERERLMPRLRAIIKAYELALGDPKAVIPSLLMTAIVVAQQEVEKS